MALAHSPFIVTSGLALCVDAGNPRSYSGSGTAWNDALGSGFNFTLNGPTYSSSNLGFLNFDGSNDIATAGYNTNLDTSTPTVEAWVKTNSLTQNGFFFEKGAVNSQYSLFQEGTNIVWRQFVGGSLSSLTVTSSTYMNTTNWYQVVGTYTTGTRRIYINGVQVASDTQTGTIGTNSSGMSIGAYGGNSGSNSYFYNGSISIVRVYNNALTANQVLQNFNATRGRYGV
jgi:hypothetical protein